jgi:hypothetical protein
MIKYLTKINTSLIENLVLDTVRTINYTIENDPSDQENYIDRKIDEINPKLKTISLKQLHQREPIINYSNYRKLFNKTLEKYYKEQVCLISIHSRVFFLFSTNYSRLNIAMISMKFVNL